MSDISKIRTLTTDQQQYFVAEAVGDGNNREFQVPNSPIYPGTAKVYVDGSLQALGDDYTLDEALGLVTFVTPPSADLVVVITGNYTILSDDQLTDLLELNADSLDPVRLSAADALDIIATSEVLIQKRIKLLDLETDGPAEARVLMQRSKALRDLVYSKDYQEADFEIVEQVNTTADWEEKIHKDLLRQG